MIQELSPGFSLKNSTLRHNQPTTIQTCLVLAACLGSLPLLAEERPIHEAVIDAGPFSTDTPLLFTWAEEVNDRMQAQTKEPAVSQLPPILHLLSHSEYHFHSDGRLTTRFWTIDFVAHRDGIELAGTIARNYTPWCDEKPSISARVILNDQSVIETPASRAFEQPRDSSAQSVYVDDRRVTLLIEGIREGAIVESSGTFISKPILGEAQSVLHTLTDMKKTQVRSILISSDPGMELTFSNYDSGVDLQLVKTDDGSQSFRAIVASDATVLELYEPLCGPAFATYPVVLLARSSSWKELGRQYAEQVDASIAAGNTATKALVASAPRGIRSGSDQEKGNWCREQIASRVRYTSLAFASQHIRPYPPDVVLRRGFGDCKDQATLYTAMLREMGVDAHVSLLKPGQGLDVRQETACIDQFTHAIAFLPSINKWVDLTSNLPLGMLPNTDCGRRTLICGLEGGRLVKTPVTSPENRRQKEVSRYTIDPGGGGEVEYQLFLRGIAGAEMRDNYSEVTQAQILEYWQSYFPELTGLPPMRVRYGTVADGDYLLSARSARAQLLDRRGAETLLGIAGTEFIRVLPEYFLPYENENGALSIASDRKHPLVITNGFQHQRIFDIRYSALCNITDKPSPCVKEFGPITLAIDVEEGNTADLPSGTTTEGETVTSELDEIRPAESNWQPPSANWNDAHDRYVRVSSVLRVEAGTMTAEQVNELLALVARVYNGEPDTGLSGKVEFDYQTLAKLLDIGRQRKDRIAYWERVIRERERYPAISDTKALLANMLFHAGLSQIGLEIIREEMAGDTLTQLVRNIGTSLELFASRILTDGGSTDYRRLHELNGDAQELFLPPKTLVQLDQTLLLDTQGHLDAQPKELDEKIRKLKLHCTALNAGGDPNGDLVFDVLVQAMLMARRDEDLLETVFAGPHTKSHAHVAIHDLLRGRVFAFDEAGVSDRAVAKLLYRLTFVSNRFDLVDQVKKLYPESIKHLPARAEQLPKLDNADPESVARWAVWHLGAGNTSLANELMHESVSDFDFSQFCIRHENLDSAPLFAFPTANLPYEVSLEFMQTSVATAKASVARISERGAEVTLRPIEATGDDWHSISIHLIERGGKWFVLPEEACIFEEMLRAYDAGNTAEALAWVDHLMPPPKLDIWNLFRPSPTLPLPVQLANRIPRTEDYRTRLILLAACAWRSNDNATMLQEWSRDTDSQLPADQRIIVERLIAESFEHGHHYKQAYQAWWRAYKASNGDDELLTRAFLSVVHDFAFEPEPTVDSKWREPVEVMVSNRKFQRNKFLFKLVTGDKDQAFQELEATAVKDAKNGDWKGFNTLLWTSLMLDEPQAVLLKRTELADSLLDSTEDPDDWAFMHTLACAYGATGQSAKALGTLSIVTALPNQPRTTLPLVRGLIALQLGYAEHARRHLEEQTNRSSDIETGLIAKHWLKKLDAKQSSTSD